MPDWYYQKKNLKKDMWYKSLPSQTSQDILQRLAEGWKSYFQLKQSGGIEQPNPPKYKPKGSHFNIKYLNNSLKVSKEYIKNGRIERGMYKLENMIYNADSGGAYNIMRLYAEEKN